MVVKIGTHRATAIVSIYAIRSFTQKTYFISNDKRAKEKKIDCGNHLNDEMMNKKYCIPLNVCNKNFASSW